jgi:hypothetical protein
MRNSKDKFGLIPQAPIAEYRGESGEAYAGDWMHVQLASGYIISYPLIIKVDNPLVVPLRGGGSAHATGVANYYRRRGATVRLVMERQANRDKYMGMIGLERPVAARKSLSAHKVGVS